MEFLLSKENIELAKEEVLVVTGAEEFELVDGVLKIKGDILGLEKRLGLTKAIIIDGRKMELSKKELMARRSHLLPAGHPTSLHPKLARALVNLTGAAEGEVILDPFCGSGGLLIEAGLMGMKIIGYDIDEIMLRRARINFDFFKIKGFELERKDATTITEHFDFIVTDLPYGKSSKVSEKDLESLYLKFFKVLEKIKPKRAVVGLPDFVDYKKLLKETNLKIKKEFSWYLHKSLTKKIIVI